MAKAQPKPELTETERHQRGADMARGVVASEDPKHSDRVFDGVAGWSKGKPKGRSDD